MSVIENVRIHRFHNERGAVGGLAEIASLADAVLAVDLLLECGQNIS